MIRNMKKYGWMTAALLLAVVGCQRREMMYLGDDVVPIHFSIAYQDAEVSAKAGSSSQALQTRALVNLDKDVTVRVFAYKRNANNSGGADPRYDDFVAQCPYVADGNGGLTPCAVKADGTVDPIGTAPDAISLNNGTYDFYAYSPALPVSKGSNNNPYVVNGITHGMDVLNDSLLNRAVSKSASTVALVFEHKCSKVTFNVKQPDGADVTKLKVDSIVLRRMNPPTNVAGWWMNTDLTSGSGYDNDTCLMKTFGDLIDNSDPSKPKLIGRTGFGIVLPKLDDASTIPANIYLTLGDSAYLFKTKFPAMEYKKGKHYTYNMNFKQTEVEFTLDVVAWNKVSVDGELGEDGNVGGVLVGSWFQRYNSSTEMGDDNAAGDIGGWKPVNPDWTIGNATGSKPGGDVGNWGDVDVDQRPGGSGGGSNPGGGVGGWGDVNDNQPGLGQ